MKNYLVTLYKSDNEYLEYPVNGQIEVIETGTDGRIIRAVFQMDHGGPVVIDHPDFEYPACTMRRGDVSELLESNRELSESVATLRAEIEQVVAAVQAERNTTERYRADWRAVCNALNTSPDSAVAIVLSKIKTLQDAAAIRARNGNGNATVNKAQ